MPRIFGRRVQVNMVLIEDSNVAHYFFNSEWVLKGSREDPYSNPAVTLTTGH